VCLQLILLLSQLQICIGYVNMVSSLEFVDSAIGNVHVLLAV